ncbi:MAG: hypothetical protein ACLTDM_00350 [Clostridium butyricum]
MLIKWLFICITGFADRNGMVTSFLVGYLLVANGFSSVVLRFERKSIFRYINILERFNDTQKI